MVILPFCHCFIIYSLFLYRLRIEQRQVASRASWLSSSWSCQTPIVPQQRHLAVSHQDVASNAERTTRCQSSLLSPRDLILLRQPRKSRASLARNQARASPARAARTRPGRNDVLFLGIHVLCKFKLLIVRAMLMITDY